VGNLLYRCSARVLLDRNADLGSCRRERDDRTVRVFQHTKDDRSKAVRVIDILQPACFQLEQFLLRNFAGSELPYQKVTDGLSSKDKLL
jgi:hypothetical protein